MEALLRLRLDPVEVKGVGPLGIESFFAASAGIIVLTNEHGVSEKDLAVAGWRMSAEGHIGIEITFVEAVEVDLEGAADMWLVVRMIVELHIVDLDRTVVARRAPGIRRRLPLGRSGVRIEQYS